MGDAIVTEWVKRTTDKVLITRVVNDLRNNTFEGDFTSNNLHSRLLTLKAKSTNYLN